MTAHSSCHPQTQGLASKTANLYSHARPHLHEGPAILGGEGPTTDSQQASPFGRVWWRSGGWMEPLVSFTEEEVLVAAGPSNWVEVSSPKPAEPTLPDTQCSHSHNNLGPTKGIPVGSPQLASTHCHQEKRQASYSTLRGDAVGSWNTSSQALCPGLQKL